MYAYYEIQTGALTYGTLLQGIQSLYELFIYKCFHYQHVITMSRDSLPNMSHIVAIQLIKSLYILG